MNRTETMSCKLSRRGGRLLLGVQLLLGSLLGVAFLLPSGCSKNAITAEVSGIVTVDGEPAETGAIGFFPTDGKSPTAGGTIKAGHYSAQVPFG